RRTQETGELSVYRTTSVAIAPTGHDERTGQNSSALTTRPFDCLQEPLRAVRVPIGEEQPGVRCQGMDHFAAQDAVLAVFRFQIPVRPERMHADERGQGVSEEPAIAAETGIENRDLHTLASKTCRVPPIYPEERQVQASLADDIERRWGREVVIGCW